MNIKLVVFDMDGTLLNTMDVIVKCNNTVLKKKGYEERKYEEFFDFVGEGTRNCVSRALPKGVGDKEISDVLSKVIKEYNREDITSIKPYDGIDKLLEELAFRDVKTAILTNKEHRYALACANTLFAKYRFETVLGDSPQTPLKPDPTGLFDIIKRSCVSKKETLFVGDMKTDVLTGKNAGVKTVGCLWGFGKKELKTVGPDFLIEHPLEILNLI